MNRWSRWAHQLRRRHGRRDIRALSGSMTLSSGVRSMTRMSFAGSRTAVHIHARLGVSWLPASALVGSPTKTLVLSSIGMAIRRPTVAASHAAPQDLPTASPGGIPGVRSAPAFVYATAGRPLPVRERTVLESQVVSLRRLVGRWRQTLPVDIETRDLPARLRRRAAREEFPVPGRAGVLARRTLEPAPAAREPEIVEHVPARFERGQWTAPAAVASPVNVEALTSQVIKQLDRRLVAYRERMGRV